MQAVVLMRKVWHLSRGDASTDDDSIELQSLVGRSTGSHRARLSAPSPAAIAGDGQSKQKARGVMHARAATKVSNFLL